MGRGALNLKKEAFLRRGKGCMRLCWSHTHEAGPVYGDSFRGKYCTERLSYKSDIMDLGCELGWFIPTVLLLTLRWPIPCVTWGQGSCSGRLETQGKRSRFFVLFLHVCCLGEWISVRSLVSVEDKWCLTYYFFFFFFFFNIYLFLAVLGLSCSMQDLLLWHESLVAPRHLES